MEDELKKECSLRMRNARRRSYSTTSLENSNRADESTLEYNSKMGMEETIKKVTQMSQFVPEKLIRLLQQPHYASDSLNRENLHGAVMIADISGFTKLSEEYALMGSEGIEEVSRHVSQYFSGLLEIIQLYGGDVMYFAGDALFVLFSPSSTKRKSGAELAGIATLNAIRCAVHVKESPLGLYRASGIRLTLHLAISAGPMSFFVVGKSKRACLLSGSPLQEIGDALSLSQKSDVVVTLKAWEILSEYLDSKSCETDTSTPLVSALCLPEGGMKIMSVYDSSQPHPLPRTLPHRYLYSRLIPFLPPIVTDKIETEELHLLGSLCTATILFISPQIKTLNFDAETQEKIHEFYVMATARIEKFEGTIRQFCIDDKGLTFIAAFSISPFVHEDDPFRSIAASLEIFESLKEIGIKSTIGIATGKVFCGKIGGEERHEFGIVGDTVNLAARLCFSKQNESILCDEHTFHSTKHLFKFREQGALCLKGRTPACAYIPLSFSQNISPHSPRSRRKYTTRLIGRELELSIIQSCKSKAKNNCQIFLLEGKPGEGKTALLDHISQTSGHFSCLKVSVLEINKTEELLIWRTIIEKLISDYPKDRFRSLDFQFRQNKFLQSNTDTSPIPPLKSRSRSTPSSIFERSITPECMIDLFKKLVNSRPTIIEIDNCHWLDSGSWEIFFSLINSPIPVVFVLSYRPDIYLEPTIQNLMNYGASYHALPPLDPASAKRLLCSHWKINSVPSLISESIYIKSKGNPLFILELANYLCQTNQVILSEGECHLPKENIKLKFPDSLSKLIGSLIAKLHPRLQTCCHVASVIGTTFSLQFLQKIYPLEISLGELRDMIQDLIRHGIFQPISTRDPNKDSPELSPPFSQPSVPSEEDEIHQRTPRRCSSLSEVHPSPRPSCPSTPHPSRISASPADTYEFSNSCLQEAAYEFLPFELRRELHSKIADAIEHNSDIHLYAYHLSRTLNFHSPPVVRELRQVSEPYPEKAKNYSPFLFHVPLRERKLKDHHFEYSSPMKKVPFSPNLRSSYTKKSLFSDDIGCLTPSSSKEDLALPLDASD